VLYLHSVLWRCFIRINLIFFLKCFHFFIVIDRWLHSKISLTQWISSAIVKNWFCKITSRFLLQAWIHSNALAADIFIFTFIFHVIIVVTNKFFYWIYLFFFSFIYWFSLLFNRFQKVILFSLVLHKIVWKLLKFVFYKAHLWMRSSLKRKKLFTIHIFNWNSRENIFLSYRARLWFLLFLNIFLNWSSNSLYL
jgi:hypothetical protein